jgi:hypothetical protein
MSVEGMASTIVKYHDGDEAYDAGWYIIYLDADGAAYDGIGPYDSEGEAKRILKETA